MTKSPSSRPSAPGPGHFHVRIGRERPCRVLLAWLLTVCAVALLPIAIAADLSPERAVFAKVLAAQNAGQHALAARLVTSLEGYPLYPYYRYNDLKRRLHTFPFDEVRNFLDTQEGSYLATRLRGDWLAQLAYARRWAAFLEFYRPSSDLGLRCHQLTARIHLDLLDEVLTDTRTVWLSGNSLPETCDPAFERLYASPLLDDELVWRRIELAREAGNDKLATYLGRRLTSPDYKALYTFWLQARERPADALARRDLPDDSRTRAILLDAVTRLARSSLESAEAVWAALAARHAFSASEVGAAARALALAAASSGHARRLDLLDRVPPAGVDAAVERYRIREAVAAGAWPELVRWTAGEPVADEDPLRWRYWRARALEATGQAAAARQLLSELARERDYYGFIAADALGQAYAFGHRPIAPSKAESSAVAAIPGLRRTHELYQLDHRVQAQREWHFELARLDRRQSEIAAHLAAQWGWTNQAITTLGRIQSYDDLELRFPLLHTDIVQAEAARRRLAPTLILAIIRSESAFVTDARSAAGALGLMQLMPATARETAKRIGLRLDRIEQLYRPAENIALGAAYLDQMLERYDGNFVMAAAAYNAGPHRVRQWQKATCIAADVWIEMIPFTETRRYVRRALFYTAVYEWRLGREITRLSSVMPPVPAARSTGVTDCGA
jgi:soluble lytic murein transglycosylase